MRLKRGELLLPLVYANLVTIFIPIMYCQLIIACQGITNGLSTLQVATLFCNAPVLLSFLGSYCKHRAEGHNTGTLLLISTTSLALISAVLSLVPFNGSFPVYLVWMLLLSLLSTSCFFSQLACFAVISQTSSISPPPSILIIDMSHAASATVGMLICYYFSSTFGGQGLLLVAAGLLSFPPLILWLLCVEDSPVPSMFVKDVEDTYCCCHKELKTYFSDERLKNDLTKEHPYLLMENDGFGKDLIDTDAQVIMLLNIVYVVTVAISQGVHCFFLASISLRSELFTLDKCCFLYSVGVILSTAVCSIARPFLLNHNNCSKVIAILYLAISNIVSLFYMSDMDAYVGKYILCYCAIVCNCQLLEDVIDAVITSYYDSIILPAMKCFSVRDYINAKVGFMHGIGSVMGPVIFGLIASDMEVASMLFTVAAIFTTITVVTSPLSALFVAAGLR